MAQKPGLISGFSGLIPTRKLLKNLYIRTPLSIGQLRLWFRAGLISGFACLISRKASRQRLAGLVYKIQTIIATRNLVFWWLLSWPFSESLLRFDVRGNAIAYPFAVRRGDGCSRIIKPTKRIEIFQQIRPTEPPSWRLYQPTRLAACLAVTSTIPSLCGDCWRLPGHVAACLAVWS